MSFVLFFLFLHTQRELLILFHFPLFSAFLFSGKLTLLLLKL